MAYEIELMSLGKDSYPLLKASANQLNGVQNEFRFRVTSDGQRAAGLAFVRNKYRTSDIWAFLNNHRSSTGGNRPYIIAFGIAPLESDELGNLFGSHQAKNGLAAVTLHDSA